MKVFLLIFQLKCKKFKPKQIIFSSITYYQNQNMQIFSNNQIGSSQSQNYIQYWSILQSYCLLYQDFNRITQQNDKLKKLIQEVEEKTHQIHFLFDKNNIQKDNIIQVINLQSFKKETNKQKNQENSNKGDYSLQINSQKKRIRKPSQKRFKCPFQQCGKLYDTSVSLNLHMKLKHKAGTKKQRQMLAVFFYQSQNSILQAIQKGQNLPQAQIQLPPDYLEVSIFQDIVIQGQEVIQIEIQHVRRGWNFNIDVSNLYFQRIFQSQFYDFNYFLDHLHIVQAKLPKNQIQTGIQTPQKSTINQFQIIEI